VETAGWILASWFALSIATAAAWSRFRQVVRRKEEAVAADLARSRRGQRQAYRLRVYRGRVA
jgi:ribosomal protein L13